MGHKDKKVIAGLTTGVATAGAIGTIVFIHKKTGVVTEIGHVFGKEKKYTNPELAKKFKDNAEELSELKGRYSAYK